jgi:ethanolamine permease
MVYFNLLVAGVFLGLMALGYAYFLTTGRRRGDALAAATPAAAE